MMMMIIIIIIIIIIRFAITRIDRKSNIMSDVRLRAIILDLCLEAADQCEKSTRHRIIVAGQPPIDRLGRQVYAFSLDSGIDLFPFFPFLFSSTSRNSHATGTNDSD